MIKALEEQNERLLSGEDSSLVQYIPLVASASSLDSFTYSSARRAAAYEENTILNSIGQNTLTKSSI